MGKVLSQHQIESYHKKGFISPIDVMSEDEANAYAEKLKAAEAKYPKDLTGVNRNNGHLCFKFLDDLAYHPKVLDAVEDLLGSSFSLWGSVLFIKEPNSSHFVSWHQDATYMGITPHNFVTPWIALTHSTRYTGCMSMIPGSHHKDIQLIRTHFNRHSNWLQCNTIGGQQWQENDTPKSLKLLRLSKSPKKGIQSQTSRDGLESPLKAFTTGEQGTSIVRQNINLTKLKKSS